MFLNDKEKRDAKILKELIAFASTLVLKDQTAADMYESYKGITYANSYISAIDGTLPVENDTPYFTSSELKDYNAIPNAPDYFVDCFRRNSLYIGSSDARLKEVSESSFNTNYGNATAPFRGNVYEANLYYRLLYCQYNCDPYDTRQAEDFSIIAFNTRAITANINLDKFNKIFNECKALFNKVMYNKAFESTQPYRSLVSFFLVTMTVIRYLDESLADLSIYKNYTAKDIKNLFYSFGFFNDSVIPAAFKEDVAKSLYKLINAKATDEAFEIVIDDIFKSNSIKLSKYVLAKTVRDDEVISDFFDCSKHYDGLNTSNCNLIFYKIPYDVVNSAEYINKMEESGNSLTPIEFEDIANEDRFWFPGDKDTAEELEELKRRIIQEMDFTVIETKYLSVSYKNDDLVKSAEKLALFFAYLHNANTTALDVESETMKETVSIFDLLIAFVYTRAIMITRGSPSNISVGDCFSTDPNGSNSEFRHFLEMLNEIIIKHEEDPLDLFEFSSKKVDNLIKNNDVDPAKMASLIAAVEDAGGKSVQEFPTKGELQSNTMQIFSLSQLIEEFRKLCDYLDDSAFASAHVEQSQEYYSPDFIEKDAKGNVISINYKILSNPDNHLSLLGNITNIDAEPDIIRELASENPELVKYELDTTGDISTNRLQVFGLVNFFELKNALHIKEAIISGEESISNFKYAGEDTYIKYLTETHPEFANRVSSILEAHGDDWLSEIEAISAALAAEIDAIFRKYEFDEIEFSALDSLAVAAFASSLIGFIKSITMQIRSSADNTLEVEVNGGAEDKMTMFDNLFYEQKQHRMLFDGSNFEDAINPITGMIVLKDSPRFRNLERINSEYFKDHPVTDCHSAEEVLDLVKESSLMKPEVMKTSELEGEKLATILDVNEELFAHVTETLTDREFAQVEEDGYNGVFTKYLRLAGFKSDRYHHTEDEYNRFYRFADKLEKPHSGDTPTGGVILLSDTAHLIATNGINIIYSTDEHT